MVGMSLGDEPDGGAGHVGQHAGLPHNAGEGAGRHKYADHHQGRGGMRLHPRPLGRGAGVVDDQRRDDPDHEDRDRFDDTRHHGPHQGEVDHEVPRPSEPPLVVRQLASHGRRRLADDRRTEPPGLAPAEPEGDGEDVREADRLHGNQGPEQGCRGHVQCG